MKISLIITTYNWPESLLLVLESVRCQVTTPSEIIVADDGSDFKTKEVINNFNNDYGLNIIHSWQEDKGFRAAKARNKAILHASGDYIILIDGDTILHPNFVKDHCDFAEPGYFVQGSRVLISYKETHKVIVKKNINFSLFSQNISNRKNSIHSEFLSYLFSSKINSIHGIKSCNMAFFREDCMKINGFNNDFEGWGREDSEFVIRLMNNGINRKNIRFKAIQYHLWHQESPRESLTKNDDILNESILNKTKWCQNGLKTMRQNES
jgi:glycosyltransferase involved in cell wall biosynthesis